MDVRRDRGAAGGPADGDDDGRLFAVEHRPPWLCARLSAPMRCLGWASVGGGVTLADRVVWREVRDADLTEDLDAVAWLAAAMAPVWGDGAVGMMTSRGLAWHHLVAATVEGVRAECCATVGLSNAERIGRRRGPGGGPGTINLLCAVSLPLTLPAQIEALSLAVAARTAAVMEAGPILATGRATGTGTDCAVLACPEAEVAAPHAGMHTAIGEAVGRAVHDAVAAGVAEWMAERAAGG